MAVTLDKSALDHLASAVLIEGLHTTPGSSGSQFQGQKFQRPGKFGCCCFHNLYEPRKGFLKTTTGLFAVWPEGEHFACKEKRTATVTVAVVF